MFKLFIFLYFCIGNKLLVRESLKYEFRFLEFNVFCMKSIVYGIEWERI